MSNLHSRYIARAQIFKALAHPSRLLVVDALADGPRCVCELREIIGADMSTVSKHLSLMKQAGLLEDEKRGVQVFYRLAIPCVTQFLGCVDTLIQARAEQWLASCRNSDHSDDKES